MQEWYLKRGDKPILFTWTGHSFQPAKSWVEHWPMTIDQSEIMSLHFYYSHAMAAGSWASQCAGRGQGRRRSHSFSSISCCWKQADMAAAGPHRCPWCCGVHRCCHSSTAAESTVGCSAPTPLNSFKFWSCFACREKEEVGVVLILSAVFGVFVFYHCNLFSCNMIWIGRNFHIILFFGYLLHWNPLISASFDLCLYFCSCYCSTSIIF